MQETHGCVETATRFAILVVSSEETSSGRAIKWLAYHSLTRLLHSFTMAAKLRWNDGTELLTSRHRTQCCSCAEEGTIPSLRLGQ